MELRKWIKILKSHQNYKNLEVLKLVGEKLILYKNSFCYYTPSARQICGHSDLVSDWNPKVNKIFTKLVPYLSHRTEVKAALSSYGF